MTTIDTTIRNLDDLRFWLANAVTVGAREGVSDEELIARVSLKVWRHATETEGLEYGEDWGDYLQELARYEGSSELFEFCEEAAQELAEEAVDE